MLPTRRPYSATWSDPFENLHREFDRMLGRLVPAGEADGGEGPAVSYPVNIDEDADNVYVEAEMPGFTKGDVDVTLENGVLTITGERKAEEPKGERHLHERRYTRLQRSFTLPQTVDESNVDAKLENGVLKLTLQKREESKPRKIQVK